MLNRQYRKVATLRFVVAIMAMIPVLASAQQPKYTEEITVIATFKPEIPDAFKINQNPINNDTSTTMPVMTYNIQAKPAGIQLAIEPLPSPKLVAEPINKLYRNYLRGGFGNYATFYGELNASSLRSKKGMFGVRIKHLSSAGTIKGFGPPANSHQVVDLTGERYFSNHVLGAEAYLNRDKVHFYGVSDSTLDAFNMDKDSLRQCYINAGGNITFRSAYKGNNKLNHAFSLGYYYMKDDFEACENNIHFNAAAGKAFDLFSIKEKQTLGLTADVQFYNQKNRFFETTNSVVVMLQPFIGVKYNEYSFKAGFSFYVQGDTVTKGHLYPYLEARLEAIPNALQIYAGIDGSMQRQTLRETACENPFIKDSLEFRYVYEKFRAYGGFSSNISKSFNLNGSISACSVENSPFFVGESSFLNNTFMVKYDDVSVMKLKADLEYVKSDRLNLALTGTYNRYYKLLYEEHPWYKPEFVISFNSRYNIQDKIILKLQTSYNGPVWALRPATTEPDETPGTSGKISEKIDGWFDGSLGVEYRFNKALSFWLNFNNFTNTRHWLWYNYPSYRFNVLGGASFSF